MKTIHLLIHIHKSLLALSPAFPKCPEWDKPNPDVSLCLYPSKQLLFQEQGLFGPRGGKTTRKYI